MMAGTLFTNVESLREFTLANKGRSTQTLVWVNESVEAQRKAAKVCSPLSLSVSVSFSVSVLVDIRA
jgi:hypothetical protein